MSENKYAWSICIDCVKSFGGCAWASEFLPVKGWAAKKIGNSYSIKACPEYVKEESKTVPADDGAVKDLINAIVERAVRDYILALSGSNLCGKSPSVTKRQLEDWSRSQYAKLLCDDDALQNAFAKIRAKHMAFCELADNHWDDEPDKNGDIKFKCPMCGSVAVIKSRKRIKEGSKILELISVKTARCSCGCEYRRFGCI